MTKRRMAGVAALCALALAGLVGGVLASPGEAWYHPTTSTGTTTTQTTTVNPCDTPSADQYGECNPPPTTTTDRPPAPRCPPNMGPYDGKDGMEGNDECCYDRNANQVCDKYELPPLVIDTQPPAQPPVVTTPTTPTEPEAPPAEEEPQETVSENPPTVEGGGPPPKTSKPKPPDHVCKPGAVETEPCGVEGQG